VRSSTAGSGTRRSRRRTAVGALLAALVALLLTGCGAGQSALTSRPYDPSLGSDARVGNMFVNDVVVVTDGTVPELQAVLVNQGSTTDTLQTLQVTNTSSVELPQGGIDVQPVNFVAIGPGGSQRVLLGSLSAGLGQLVQVTFFFSHAGRVSLSAIVVLPNALTAGT
jgi:hypothetical protein